MSESAAWPRGIPRVGQTAERSRTVAPTDIERFTEISGDRNPLHYDEEVARSTRFGEIVVQGCVTSRRRLSPPQSSPFVRRSCRTRTART